MVIRGFWVQDLDDQYRICLQAVNDGQVGTSLFCNRG
jgi:hypothetical protein